MKIKRLISICLAVCLTLAFSATAYASDVHSTGNSFVDDGEIRWTANNWYSSNRDAAISNWNNLGLIGIVPDTIWSIADVDFTDVYRSDVAWAGITYYLYDSIQVNNFYLDKSDSDSRTNVFAHEIGHGLGIGDHDSSMYQGCLMYWRVQTVTTPQLHDIADYTALWKK